MKLLWFSENRPAWALQPQLVQSEQRTCSQQDICFLKIARNAKQCETSLDGSQDKCKKQRSGSNCVVDDICLAREQLQVFNSWNGARGRKKQFSQKRTWFQRRLHLPSVVKFSLAKFALLFVRQIYFTLS